MQTDIKRSLKEKKIINNKNQLLNFNEFNSQQWENGEQLLIICPNGIIIWYNLQQGVTYSTNLTTPICHIEELRLIQVTGKLQY